MKVSELNPYQGNPRNHDEAVASVAASIKEFGFKVPIIITKEHVIVAGHTRLKASLQLGLKEVPCIIADDLTEDQIKAFRLADNKTAELASWDFSKLEAELIDIDIDMLQFGFEELEESLPDNAADDDFDIDGEIPEIPFSQVGDIYELGVHRVMCGDSTSEADVAKLVDGKQVDMIFTDPPYNVDYEGTAGEIKNDKMEDN
jgi:ParB-like chromosome segregation protein Spo0J